MKIKSGIHRIEHRCKQQPPDPPAISIFCLFHHHHHRDDDDGQHDAVLHFLVEHEQRVGVADIIGQIARLCLL